MIKHAEGRRFLHKENNTFEAMQQEVSVTQKSTEVELWGVSLEVAGGEKYRSCNRRKRKTTRGSALPKPELSNCIHSWTLTTSLNLERSQKRLLRKSEGGRSAGHVELAQ